MQAIKQTNERRILLIRGFFFSKNFRISVARNQLWSIAKDLCRESKRSIHMHTHQRSALCLVVYHRPPFSSEKGSIKWPYKQFSIFHPWAHYTLELINNFRGEKWLRSFSRRHSYFKILKEEPKQRDNSHDLEKFRSLKDIPIEI